MAVSTRRDVMSTRDIEEVLDRPIDWIPYDVIASNPLYRDRTWLTDGWTPDYRFCKRAIDILLSAAFLVMILPLFPLIAVAIKLDSPGPVIYSQLRLGVNSKPFRIYKFRSMREDAEATGAVYAEADDPRVTRVGRFLRRTRLDELPQIWNVLRGEMSIIGPRPERPENEQMLEEGIPGFSMRTCVKPGLTGWAQIRAPYANTVEQSTRKLEFDLYYIRHASLWLDLRIARKTALVMLRLAGQ